MLISGLRVCAQEDPEYRMEIGAGAGMMGYLGDFNGNLTKDLQPMGTVLARYIFNPYMGLKLNVSYGKMKGKSTDVETYYPDLADNPYEFSNSLLDIGLTYERSGCEIQDKQAHELRCGMGDALLAER